MTNNWLNQYSLPKLNCLVPVYGSGDDAGNYTEVWLDDGHKILDRRRTRTVLKHLAAFMGISSRPQKTPWSRDKQSQLPPIILGPDTVLVPLRLRRPRNRDEGGTGYVVANKIIRCEPYTEGPYRSRLYLRGDQVLPCLLRLNTLLMRLAQAREALQARQMTYRDLKAAAYACESSHLLLGPDGNATPVQVIERRQDLIVLRQENHKPPGLSY
ncbi:MAG: hypothetical protein GX039_03565 [Clostridia bacterium]|nr:hypothetical protein [Clostridia bacterium]